MKPRPKSCTCPEHPLEGAIDPARYTGVWFGFCFDRRMHRDTCPVGRAAMREAKFPDGRWQYPELRALR